VHAQSVQTAAYNFAAISPTVDLSPGVANTVMLPQIPPGVNGSDMNHPLLISDGADTEVVFIGGGDAVSGSQTGGTIVLTPAHPHTVGYSIQSATSGIREALRFLIAVIGGSNMKTPYYNN
jgi:hypothetical protein